MRKQLLSALALLAIIAPSCKEEGIEAPAAGPEQEMVFHAVCGEADPASRTVRQEDGKVFWSVDEEISVFQGHMTDGGKKFVSMNTSVAPSADFTGSLPSSSGYYWALYPYDPASWCYNGNYVVCSFTNQQTAVAGSFPDDLYIALAKSTTKNLSFKHPLGGIKFSVVSSGIKKVTLKSNGGEALASDLLAIDINSSGEAFIGAYNESYTSIELTPQGGGTFVPGKDYYFVTMPVVMEKGFTLLFEHEDGSFISRSVDKKVEIKRVVFRTLPEADKGFTWAKMIYSPSSVNIGPQSITFSINVTYKGTPHVDVASGDWISAVSTSGSPETGCTYYFKAQTNTGAKRTGVINVCDDSNCYPVIVTQEAGTSLKTITHHSLGMRFTATWCGYCPIMNESFAKAKAALGDKFYILNLHASGSDLYFEGTAAIAAPYNGTSSLPTGIIDGRFKVPNYTNTDYCATVVQAGVKETEDNYPVMTSIGLKSSLSGRTISVTADVFAAEPDTYKLTVLLLESGVVKKQIDNVNGNNDSYVHDNAARMALSAYTGDTFTVPAGNVTRQFNYSATIPSSYNINNMTILAYVQKQYGGQIVLQSGDYGLWYVDNSRVAPLGATLAPEVE